MPIKEKIREMAFGPLNLVWKIVCYTLGGKEGSFSKLVHKANQSLNF